MTDSVVQASSVPVDPLGRALDHACRALALIGGILLVGLTLTTTYSIFMRAFFDEPLLGDVELVQMGCGIAIVFFLPLCQLRRGNVIVDVFTLRASPWVRRTLDALGSILMALAGALLAWRSLIGTLDAYGTGEETVIMGLPIWWTMCVFVPALGLLALVALYTAWQDIRDKEPRP